MKNSGYLSLWRWLSLGMMALLAACQTVPHQSGFNQSQVAMLEAQGFARVEDHYELGLSNRVLFAFDSSELKPEIAAMLEGLSRNLLSVGIGGVSVEGHTDSLGDANYNVKLSEDRAQSVKRALVGSGMREARIRTLGLGESDPIAPNSTEEGRQQNRRVVIIVTPADAMAL